MTTQLSPYLKFNGNTREAMTFYKEVFGGELSLQTVAETPMAAQCPVGIHHHIMHSMLANNGFVLMASDMQGPEGFIQGTDMALSLNFSNEADINQCYEQLSKGGIVPHPLKQSEWGALFAVVVDKFNKVWLMNCDKK